jgi:hypothetical protein
MEYCTDQSGPAWADRFLRCMATLLEHAADAPGTPVADMPMLSASPHHSDAAVNTDSSLSRSIRLMSGGGSGGAGSGALARMNSGTGERTSARPQAPSASAPPTTHAI